MTEHKQAPNTIEEMVHALRELEQQFGSLDRIPYANALIPTHIFFRDLCNRLIALERHAEIKQDTNSCVDVNAENEEMKHE